jgi:CxxC motif-containing protein (DUF1111 family)
MRARLALALLAAVLTGAAGAAELDATLGRALFRRAWVPAPASTRANDGLGPLHNARACVACHAGLERPAAAPGVDGLVASEALVLRLGDADGRPDPVYGRQLQTGGVAGVLPEITGVAAAAEGFAPVGLAYGPLGPETRVGALLAPPLRGLGGLEGVPDAALAALAEANARAGRGGRVRWIEGAGGRRAGRFGAKAGAATLEAQVQLAFHLDLGFSTRAHPEPWGDCTPGQTLCRAAPHGARAGAELPEIPDAVVARVAAYLASIPPPAPSAADDGRHLFAATGCAACHMPALPGAAGPVAAFTDLLLHDLGPALAGAPEPGAGASEWRTAPLWGLSRRLDSGLMHDGRARGVRAAVSLHGGEGARARAAFEDLPEAERRRLVAYLEAL